MIENMEECGNSLLGSSPLLNIVDNQHVYRLVEIDEVVDRVLTAGIGKLHLKQTGRDVEHTFLWVSFLATEAYSINKVCLTTTRRTIDEEGIESRLTRMLCDRQANGTWQFVTIALNK